MTRTRQLLSLLVAAALICPTWPLAAQEAAPEPGGDRAVIDEITPKAQAARRAKATAKVTPRVGAPARRSRWRRPRPRAPRHPASKGRDHARVLRRILELAAVLCAVYGALPDRIGIQETPETAVNRR